MIAVLALLLGVVMVTTCSPTLLNLLINQRVDPQAILVTWAALAGTAFLTVVAALGMVLLPTHEPAPLLLQLVHHCWLALRHGSAPRWHEGTALVLLAVISTVAVQVGRGFARYAHRQKRLHGRHLELLRITAEAEAGPFPTMWLQHPQPLAYSVSGAPALVIATTGVRDTLGEASTAAVIEHERAHLRGRHHLLVGLADALARSVPWIPLARHSPGLVRTAVELAADRAAAHVHGSRTVRSALLIMSKRCGGPAAPQHALCMADERVALRLQHLEHLAARRSTTKRALISAIAGVTAATLPALVGFGTLVGVGMICPMPFAG